MSGQLPPFPVTREDIAESIASSVNPPKERSSSVDIHPPSPKRPTRSSNPSTAPGSARGTPPPGRPLYGSGLLHVNCGSFTPTLGSSRRGSSASQEIDSRRSSVTRITDAVKDLRKGVRNVTDSTKKATHKVKDKTAGMGAHVKVATVGASKWVANHTSKTAKAAMDQARSGLSVGEKFTLFAFEKISTLSRRGFTHVFMFAILLGYTALGAILFIACEAPHEEKEKLAITEERNLFIEAIWNKKNSVNYKAFVEEAKVMLEPYEDQLYRSFSSGVSSDTEDRVWTFWKAMFFCSTITTTIGYGHITPKTTAGRALTIVYALIGIPIFLILMADFGKLFTRLLKHLFIFIRRVYRSGTCVKARKHPTVQGLSQRATGRIDTIKNFLLCRKRAPSDTEKGPKPRKEEKVEGSGFVVGAMGNSGLTTNEDEEKYFTDGNFNLPISLALLILILYMIIGCIIYISWEEWTFFEAFYFIFVSMTTIGFGDFVPEHPAFMMATALYLVFGLALTAMCINIIQEKLTNKFREASVKLKVSFSKIMEATAMANQDEAEAPATEKPSDKLSPDNIIITPATPEPLKNGTQNPAFSQMSPPDEAVKL